MEKDRYITVKNKFILTIALSVCWILACAIIDWPWYQNLVKQLGILPATFVVFGVAILPGVMICYFSLTGLLFDTMPHPPIHYDELEDITILVAAYNEEDCIFDTIKSIAMQEYPRKLIVKVIDNNSHDNTKSEILKAIEAFPELDVEYMFEEKQGKHEALNAALPTVSTNYYITIDADTYLYKNAILTLSNQMIQQSKNKHVAAIAGTILVRNSRVNLLTKMEEWEYFLSIATIKRSQGLFQTTMVAQGAFSIYNTKLIQRIGGYKNTIAEDIVLTWEALSSDVVEGEHWRTYYCDNAICFTNVPTTFRAFARQRVRWARGSIEGFKHFHWKTCTNPYTKFYMFVNYMNILGEISTVFIFIPGLLMAIFLHNSLLFSWCTCLLFSVTALIYFVMLRKQTKNVFKPLGLKVRRHYLALVVYMIAYALILSPICLWGYYKELTGAARKWK